jgi:tetratricopeptide (TPR) repeat protein
MDGLGIEIAFPWFILTAAYHALGEYEAELAATDEAIARIGLAWGFLGPGVPALAALGRIDALERRIGELQHVALEGGTPGGPTALATAVIELRAHGYAADAAALFATLDPTPLDPGTDPRGAAAWEARMRALYELGRWEEAARMHEVAPRTPRSDIAWTGMLGLLAARQEDPETARRIADQLEAIDDPFLFGEETFLRARIEAVLGDHSRAITLIRQAFAEGLYGNGWYGLHMLRDFDPLRGLPAFRELVEPRG